MSIHPHHRRPLTRALAVAALGGLLVAAFMLPNLRPTLPPGADASLRILLELLSVLACLLVFSVSRASLDRSRGSLVPVVGAGFLGVALLESVHVLLLDGMPLAWAAFDPGLPIATSVAARLLASLALAAVAVMAWDLRVAPRARLALFGGCAAAAVAVAAWSLLDPVLARAWAQPDGAPTHLRLVFEGLVGALLLLAAVGLLRRLAQPQSRAAVALFFACCLLALAHLCLAREGAA